MGEPATAPTMQPRTEAVLGVDGCPGGWLGASVTGREVSWLLLADAAAILAVDASAIGIDIPIGLPESGRRECDVAARLALGVARNSVFFTPVRATLAAGSYPEANALSRDVTGKGMSKQTWNILDRIADVDSALGEPPDPRIVEVHPELSFRRLDPAVGSPKRTAAGAGQRISALGRWLDVAEAIARVPPGPTLDDALDALVAAWSARRWLSGTASALPAGDPPLDALARPMRIVS